MGIRFGSKLKLIDKVRISTVYVSGPKPEVLRWSKPTGNIGTFPSGSNFFYWLGAVDPKDAIDVYSVVGGQLPPGILLNPFSGELEGKLPDTAESRSYMFTIRVRTTDNRQLFGDFSMRVEYTELVVNWITPAGSLGEYDIGAPVFTPLRAESNK